MTQTATGTPSLRLAEWARRSGTSALQTMLSVGTRPGTISLALGLPAPELFPAAEYGSASAAVLHENPVALQYSPPHAPLQKLPPLPRPLQPPPLLPRRPRLKPGPTARLARLRPSRRNQRRHPRPRLLKRPSPQSPPSPCCAW